MATNLAGLPPIAGSDKAGVKVDVNHPEVQAYMRQFPAVNSDAAIGSVLQQMNARAAGQTPMATPASAGTPGFGGGLSPGQAPGYTPPVITPPTGGAGTGGGDPTNPLYGSQSAFMNAFSQIMNKSQKNQSLQDQKNLLLKQLYDTPLTPDELRTLSPAQQQAIQSADKSMVEFQILSMNDIIKGRSDDTKQSLDYMVAGYNADLATAKELQTTANQKRDDARTIVFGMIDKYGDTLSKAGITQDEINNILKTGEISSDLAVKLTKAATLKQTATDTSEALKLAGLQQKGTGAGSNITVNIPGLGSTTLGGTKKTTGGSTSVAGQDQSKYENIVTQLDASRGVDDGFVNTGLYKKLRTENVALFKKYFDNESQLYLNPNDSTAGGLLKTKTQAYNENKTGGETIDTISEETKKSLIGNILDGATLTDLIDTYPEMKAKDLSEFMDMVLEQG